MREFLDACAKQGIEVRACEPEEKQSKASRIAFPSAREELEAAASWARARLDSVASSLPFPLRDTLAKPGVPFQRGGVRRGSL